MRAAGAPRVVRAVPHAGVRALSVSARVSARRADDDPAPPPSERAGEGSAKRAVAHDPLPTFPPGTKQPETIVFDEPAVPNPHRTANAHAAFRRGWRVLLVGVCISLAVGGSLYGGWTALRADDGSEPPGRTASALSLSGLESLYADLKRGVTDSQASQTAQFMLLSLSRSTTIVSAVGLCVWDYRRVLNASHASAAEEEEHLRQCHLRCARRLLEALQANGGLYIKLGQHLSSVILLPPEWTATLRPLQDENTPTPLADLEVLFKEDTGQSFDEAFTWLDPKPLGVASLAQVHKACDRRTGEVLAVKMLHPDVERFSQADMKMVTILVHWVKRIFPQFSFEWLADEMNKNMPLELDFRHEAANSQRAREDFAQYRKTCVYFPRVPWVHRRVMAMEFIEGCRPDNLAFLAEHKINRNRVSQELSKIFSQMLYLHGFFHADPHGGNLLIRPRPTGSRSRENFEIVLLDHGLYFEIDDELRANYARFWLALLSRSTPHVQRERRKYAKLVGNIDDDLYPILESAITGRSGLQGSDDGNPHGVQGKQRMSSLLDIQSSASLSENEQEHIRRTVMKKEGLVIDIMELLRRVPRAMLMVLKINDLTRSLDAHLHTTHGPARPFIITARYCALAVHRDDQKRLSGRWRTEGFSFGLVKSYLWSAWNYTHFYHGLLLLERCSDVVASVRRYFIYFRALFHDGFDTSAAKRAAAGLDEQARNNQREQADRDRAIMELQDDLAEDVAAEDGELHAV
ncbi:hypothetical protein MSPP1_001742 [Malassezia sp. CBS 17886]|nr:hypothetical protein MSPP1_001742 [Malassezia sp. CBS 17886]